MTTLHEGDDFGQLALVNDAPRAATIVLGEDNCHFLRVDKQDFNRIIKVLLLGWEGQGHVLGEVVWGKEEGPDGGLKGQGEVGGGNLGDGGWRREPNSGCVRRCVACGGGSASPGNPGSGGRPGVRRQRGGGLGCRERQPDGEWDPLKERWEGWAGGGAQAGR